MRTWYAIIIIMPLSLFVLCAIDVGGGISDHGNERVAGAVANADGSPAAGVTVTLLPDEYNPITDSTRVAARLAITDVEGRYAFDSLDAGNYALQADDRRSGFSGIAKNVVVGENAEVKGITLNATGSICFNVDSNSLSVGMMVYLPGLKQYNSVYYDSVDLTRKVRLFDVPAGRITLKAYDPVLKMIMDLDSDFVDIEIIPGVILLLPSCSPQPYCLSNEAIVQCGHGYVGDVFTFSPVHPSKKIDGNYIYRFSWGEGTISDWSSDIRWQWTWNKPGTYFVQSQVMWRGQYLAWSKYISIEIYAR